MYQKTGEPNTWYLDEDDEDPDQEEQPVRKYISRKGVGIIEMDYYEDQMVMWCPFCKKAGFNVRLGPKIIMPGQKREADYDQWLQCPDCYEVVAAHVIEHDASIIRDDIETVESPFENQSVVMGAFPRRTRKTMAKQARKRNRPQHKDPEIQRELDQHGSDNVHIIQDSDP